MKNLFVVFTVLVLAALPVHAAGKLIRPGRSVGDVTLGSTRPAIQKLLGKPSETKTYKGGLVEDRWNSRLKNAAGFNYYMTVMFKTGKAIQIKITSSEYETQQQYSTATALSLWKKTYKGMRESTYGYDFPHISYAATYYDAVQTGIAFVKSSRDDWKGNESADAIVIHRAGQRVIAEPGWTLSDDEK